ncbi:MAG: hypothetical protein AB1513_01170 [Pseudomonadota bacterium]
MKSQPYRQNPWLRRSYSLLAPFYVVLIAAPMQMARARSLAALPNYALKMGNGRICPGKSSKNPEVVQRMSAQGAKQNRGARKSDLFGVSLVVSVPPSVCRPWRAG